MRIRLAWGVLATGAILAGGARATTLVQLSLEQLSRASSAIVRGRVVSQESRRSPEGKQVVTWTTVAVEQTLKGRPPRTLVVEQPGGAMGNLRVRVPGTARLNLQEQYYLFLEPAAEGGERFRPVGMVQGAYRIAREEKTGEERVLRPMGGMFYGPGRRAAVPAPVSISTREFQQQVARALAAPVVVPRGTAIPVSIRSTESRGAGRIRVEARTTRDLFPSSTVVIPAGSVVEGVAQRSGGSWMIHWTGVSFRGQQAAIDAASEEVAEGSLRGRVLVIKVR
jgi:hypothetical protein